MRGPFALSFGGIDSEERTPEASRILAGGANHRFRPRNAASPGRGDGMIVARFPLCPRLAPRSQTLFRNEGEKAGHPEPRRRRRTSQALKRFRVRLPVYVVLRVPF